jgi:hypothetical protein
MTAFAPRSSTRTNRRRQPRIDVDAPARLTDGTTVLTGKIENISLGGASFITPQIDPELAVGAAVTLVAPSVGDDGKDLENPSRIIRTDVLFDASGEVRSYALAFDPAADDGKPADADSAP